MDLRGCLAESSFPTPEFRKSFFQFASIEVGPKCVRDVQFRISDLPQQEVAYPEISPGSHQEIRIGDFGVIKALSQGFLINRLRGELTLLNAFRQSPRRIDDFLASPIRDTKIQFQFRRLKISKFDDS